MWGDPDNPQIEGANGIRNTTAAGGDGESDGTGYTSEDEEESQAAEGGEESSMTDEERDAQDRKRAGKKRGGVWISGYWQARGSRK
jgi:hypothetical protein